MTTTQKEIDELLKPRFEVIEEYPRCIFKKGDILLPIPRATNPWYHTDINCPIGEIQLPELEKHPHLFRKMKWWEKRSEDEMPMYLKHTYDLEKPNYSYHKILKWDIKNLDGFTNVEKREVCSLLIWSTKYTYIPISEEEYNENNQ
jgi:hypothetical protein